MKFIGKLLLYILIALLVAIAGLYFLCKPAGEQNISAHGFPRIATIIWPSGRSITVFPRHLISCWRTSRLVVMAARDPGGQKCRHCASSRQLTEPRHVDTILLENGTLNLTDQTAPLPFKADRLQLRDMAFNNRIANGN